MLHVTPGTIALSAIFTEAASKAGTEVWDWPDTQLVRIIATATKPRTSMLLSPLDCTLSSMDSLSPLVRLFGSAQETGEGCCSCGLLKGDEFCPGGGEALGLQQQVSQVLVSPAPPQQGLDVSIDGFHDAQRDFHAAIVQDAVQVVQ